MFYIKVPNSCVHVNYLPNSTEAEFLFVPYSVFTVTKYEDKSQYYTEICIEAAADNKDEDDELILSNWH